jgi:hypothetical protein
METTTKYRVADGRKQDKQKVRYFSVTQVPHPSAVNVCYQLTVTLPHLTKIFTTLERSSKVSTTQ